MGIKRGNPHKGCAHCLVCVQSLKKFLLFSVSGVFGRKGTILLPSNSSREGGQGLLGALGASLNPHDVSLLSICIQGPSLSRKKKILQRGLIHFCNYISFIDLRACFSVNLFLRRTASYRPELT